MIDKITKNLINFQLNENPSDVLSYINRLEKLFEKTSDEYLLLKNKSQKTKNEELELILLKNESKLYYKNLLYVKKLYSEHTKNKFKTFFNS